MREQVLEVVAADESPALEAEIRAVLARTRPEERGELIVTRRSDAFGRAVLEYFERRGGSRFCTFLAHWQDAGGIVLDATDLGSHLPEMLAFDGDTVYGCKEGFDEVFAADRTVDDEGVTFEFFTVDLPARMQPSCFLIGSVDGETVLYLAEVSTVECLEQLPQGDLVTILELGATLPDGNWIDSLELSPDSVVADVVGKLKESPQLSIVDFAASVGSIRFSTHDDGEANFRFRSREEAFGFLRKALAPALAAELIPRLSDNFGRYVVKREGSWKSFETFDAYLAGKIAKQ